MTDLDLSPREVPDTSPRSWRNWVIVGLFCLVGGAVLFQALTSARVYFLNVDEAIERQGELGDDTFNMQGTVITEPTTGADNSMLFTITFGGQEANIRHIGDEPTDLFGVGEPVVAKGRWDGDVFVSEQVLIKHSEQYVEDNGDRLDDVEQYDVEDNDAEESEAETVDENSLRSEGAQVDDK